MRAQKAEGIPQALIGILPKLDNSAKKGDNGCIGVIGGSFQYTGAPFYAAMTALKAGADLSHIFCAKSAAIPIKSYSPQVIVHPLFVSSHQLYHKPTQQEIETLHQKWLDYFAKFYIKIKSWIIGPGLGRDQIMVSFFPKLMSQFPQKTIITLDADGLYMLCQHPYLLEKIRKLNCIATPNHTEFRHLNKIIKLDVEAEKEGARETEGYYYCQQQMKSHQLPLTLVKKGEIDQIYTKEGRKFLVGGKGSSKRCGGIGDVLAGCIGTFSCWDYELGVILACIVCKLASRKAFEKEGRALTAPNIIEAVAAVMREYP